MDAPVVTDDDEEVLKAAEKFYKDHFILSLWRHVIDVNIHFVIWVKLKKTLGLLFAQVSYLSLILDWYDFTDQNFFDFLKMNVCLAAFKLCRIYVLYFTHSSKYLVVLSMKYDLLLRSPCFDSP